MKPIDYGKAALAGLALLILNLLATTAVIFAWAMLVEPGKSQAHYNALAPQVGAVSGPLGGVLLLFLAAYLLGRRRPARNAIAFAVVLWVAYAGLDVLAGLPMAPMGELFTPRLALSLCAALVAAFGGAILATRRNGPTAG